METTEAIKAMEEWLADMASHTTKNTDNTVKAMTMGAVLIGILQKEIPVDDFKTTVNAYMDYYERAVMSESFEDVTHINAMPVLVNGEAIADAVVATMICAVGTALGHPNDNDLPVYCNGIVVGAVMMAQQLGVYDDNGVKAVLGNYFGMLKEETNAEEGIE